MYFSDEAWIHLDGYVNSHNYRIWSEDNPHAFIETDLHPRKIEVWCGISRKRVIGPLFIDSTINSPHYQCLIKDFLDELPFSDRLTEWFQQDGATPHSANQTMKM